jgi:pyrroline-5-carboxylate reductase
MTLGFLGTGAISSAIVTGLSASGAEPPAVRVSPRNDETATDLAKRFANVSIASSNQDVLDSSDTVIVAVRPPIAAEVLSDLRFGPEHRVISVVSGLSLESLASLVAPATQIARAVPLPSVANRMGPTAVFPADGVVENLFASIGTVYEVRTEAEFNAICATTATVASFYVYMDKIASWLSSQGLPEALARDYVARMFLGEASMTSDLPEKSFQSLARAHTTPGGTNEQFLRHLSERGLMTGVPEGLDQILQRIRPAPEQ